MMHEPSDGKPDVAKLAADYRAAVRPAALDKLAVALGVSAESLWRMRVGWSAKNRAWAFPMSNAAGDVLGIRLRLPSARKLSVKGGKEGLFIPEGIDAGGLLLIAEGPTDTAALLDLGFSAVGRPSCTGGAGLLVELVRKLKPSGVVIVADADMPGQRGAESLAAALVAYCSEVRIITPPAGVKDAREWKRNGATAADVTAAIDAAPVRKLRVSVRRKAGHDAK
jgi:DNA primase